MKLVRESIEFTRGGDPKRSLRIGGIVQIEKWFKEWAPDVEYTVDSHGNISVKDELWLTGRRDLESLPPEIKTVEGSLDLEGSSIKSLPPVLFVDGYLDLRRTSVEELPVDLEVVGDLILTGLSIKKWPKRLIVGRSLLLGKNSLSDVPKNSAIRIIQTAE